MNQDSDPGMAGNDEQAAKRDPIRELQQRLEAAIEEVRPKIRRAMEELDTRVDAAMAEVKPRAEAAMNEVRPKVDEFVTEVQPRLDSLLERLSARIDELRRDLSDRAARRDETTGAPAGHIGSGSTSSVGVDEEPPSAPGQQGDGSPGV